MKKAIVFTLMSTVFLLLCSDVLLAAELHEDRELRYSSEKQLEGSAGAVFPGAAEGSAGIYEEGVVFSVGSCESEKAFLFLEAEAAEETDWDEFTGTREAVYAHYFSVRRALDDLRNTHIPSPDELAEAERTFYETYHTDPETQDLYDNAYSLLLKKLTLTVRTNDREGGQTIPLTKKAPLFSAAEGQRVKARISLTVPDGLSEQERQLLSGITWKFSAEEYNSSPLLEAGITELTKPANGEYYVQGETVSVMLYYNNPGDVDLIHVIGRLVMRGEGGEDVISISESVSREKKPVLKLDLPATREGFSYNHAILQKDAEAGSVCLRFEVEASCVSPEFPERMRETAEYTVPAGFAGKGGISGENGTSDKPGAGEYGVQETPGEGATGQGKAPGKDLQKKVLIIVPAAAAVIAAGIIIFRIKKNGRKGD